MKRLLRFLFRCRHRRVSWVFNDDAGLYSRCCDCGERLPPRVDFSGNARVLVRIESTKEKATA